MRPYNRFTSYVSISCWLLTIAGAAAQAGCGESPEAEGPPSSLTRPLGVAGGSSELQNKELCGAVSEPGRLRCHARVRTGLSGEIMPAAGPAGLNPIELRGAYRLENAGGQGKTVAIVDAYDDPNVESDLAVYRAQFGMTPCTTANRCFRKVNQSGLSSPLPTPNAAWAAEIALDVQMVSAACPDCSILLVEADSNSSTDLFTAVNTAVRLGASVVSNSYGGGEYNGIQNIDAMYFNHPGVGIFVSSGDAGFGVEYPASSQYVTAVGGTTLRTSPGGRGWTETAWSGSGSGCSQYIPKPVWQRDSGCARRTVADVSAVADPSTGVSVYNTYSAPGWAVYGGTSVAAPLVAAAYAISGNSAVPPSFPYERPGAFFDITSGANGTCTPTYLCTAGPGYDGPTGIGSPNGGFQVTLQDSGFANTSGSSSYMQKPDANPFGVYFITQNWDPGARAGVYNAHPTGVRFDGGAKNWAIFNEDGAAMPLSAAFNVYERPPASNVYTHIATTSNSAGNYTLLDNIWTNNNPDALIWVTHNLNPGLRASVFNNRNLGVFYHTTARKWAIFNQDLAAVPTGASFNVLVESGPVANHYFVAKAGSTVPTLVLSGSTYMDSHPNALILMTPVWNPGGSGGVYNNHPVGVYYNGSGKWAVFNEDGTPIPAGAAFNVWALSPGA